MARQTKTPNIDPRDLWLAGLGAVSLTRKQAVKAYGVLVEEGTQFRDATGKRIDALASQAREGLDEVKAKASAAVDPLLARASSAYDTVRSELESRLSPVVAGFTRAKPAKRKPAAKKAPAKAVKKATPRKAAPRRAVKKAA